MAFETRLPNTWIRRSRSPTTVGSSPSSSRKARWWLEDPAEVDQLLAELDAAGLDLGDVEEIVDQGAQPVRALGRHLEEALLHLRHGAAVAVEHQLDVAAERRERRPQLVRDHRHELVLHALHGLALGHVADDDDVGPARVRDHGADRQLGGEPRAVLAHALDLGPCRRPCGGGPAEREPR
jgi:hypothetical protein